jgi:hypothetical protein
MATRSGKFQPKPKSTSACLALCLALSLSQACARRDAFRQAGTSASSPDGQKLPFHETTDHAADDSTQPAIPPDRKSAASTPFHAASHSRSLPAGTLITVRLEGALSIARIRPGDSFSASVAGPLTIDGDTLIERGTPVSGRVEATQPSADRPGQAPDPAFIRLTLNTITVDGHTLPLQTSSLFATATPATGTLAKATFQTGSSPVSVDPNLKANDFRLVQGRRLTFRLTAPVILPDTNSIADGQAPDSSKP